MKTQATPIPTDPHQAHRFYLERQIAALLDEQRRALVNDDILHADDLAREVKVHEAMLRRWMEI